MGFINGPGKIKIGPGMVQVNMISQVIESQYVVHAVHDKSNLLKLIVEFYISGIIRKRVLFFQELQEGRTAWTTWSDIDSQVLKKILLWAIAWTDMLSAWANKRTFLNIRGTHGPLT